MREKKKEKKKVKEMKKKKRKKKKEKEKEKSLNNLENRILKIKSQNKQTVSKLFL